MVIGRRSEFFFIPRKRYLQRQHEGAWLCKRDGVLRLACLKSGAKTTRFLRRASRPNELHRQIFPPAGAAVPGSAIAGNIGRSFVFRLAVQKRTFVKSSSQ
jgi:hypothetical protein